MGVAHAVDVSKLDVCFGGFTPMALSDGIASCEQVEKAQLRAQLRRASLEKAAAIEAARASDARRYNDPEGNLWHYVVLDGAEVRVEKCEPRSRVLVVPERIAGMPVVALAADACASLPELEEVFCPDSMLSIGFCAFRRCAKLRRARLPRNLATFDSGWFRSCSHLEHLVLPGRLEQLESNIFDLPGLRTLVIGAGTGGVAPGAFAKSNLASVEVDDENPFLKTDGKALYSYDGEVLAALAVPVARLVIQPGCRVVGKKGLSGFSCVEQVDVPASLEVLGPFAFSGTSITRFEAPPSLRHVMEKAFFNCESLREVRLNEGLRVVEASAFAGTSLHALEVPSTVCEIGHPLAERSALTYAGSQATFSVAAESPCYLLDEAGGLYRKGESGLLMERMMDPDAHVYRVLDGTKAICEDAFFGLAELVEVILPEGLERVDGNAFRSCRRLSRVNLPAGLRRIGEGAFLETSLKGIHIPASLELIGDNALVTYGGHRGKAEPSLRQISVEEGNAVFYTACGCLLERKASGLSRVVLCSGSEQVVCIPEEVDEIAPYAFSGLRGISELRVSERVRSIGIRGLAIDGLVDLIHVDLTTPVEGHEFFDIRFPHTDRGAQQQALALGMLRTVNVESLLEHYDNAIVNASSFDSKSSEGLSLYEQSTGIIARLLDPVFLSVVNRGLGERVLKRNIAKISASIAKRDDRRSIDALLDLGYINENNIYAVIESVGSLQDAGMTGYLLEVKRMRFGQDAFDFDL